MAYEGLTCLIERAPIQGADAQSTEPNRTERDDRTNKRHRNRAGDFYPVPGLQRPEQGGVRGGFALGRKKKRAVTPSARDKAEHLIQVLDRHS